MTDRSQVTPNNISDSDKARRIAQHSPEGLPTNPNAGPRQIGLLLAAAVVVVMGAGVVVAAFISPIAGLTLGALGVVIFATNPTAWASALRAKERERLDE